MDLFAPNMTPELIAWSNAIGFRAAVAWAMLGGLALFATWSWRAALFLFVLALIIAAFTTPLWFV